MTKGPPTALPQALTIVTTEHFALQGARSATIADSSSRAALFLSSVSGTLLSLSLLSTAIGLGRSFLGAALAAALPLIFLGFATFVRVLESGLEDGVYARGINRMRHYYLEHAPELAPYFIQTDHDDLAGMLVNAGMMRHGRQQAWFTTAGAIGVITSVLIGWCATGVLALLRLPSWLLIAGGLTTFVVAALSFMVSQRRAWVEQERRLPAQFPTPEGNAG